MIEDRPMPLGEIDRIWTINRSEVIEGFYRCEKGALVRERSSSFVEGFPPGEAEKYTPLFAECLRRGGWLQGLFDGDRLVGSALLDSGLVRSPGERIQLLFLYVDADYRGQGLGKRLFKLASAEARRKGAAHLYISAAPTENTVDFYLRLGCFLARHPDSELLAREPEDIHLERPL